MAWGYSSFMIADELGVTQSVVSNWLMRESVTSETASRVANLFDRLSTTPGPSKSAATRAKRKGWPLPMEWDDDEIDDPSAQPGGARKKVEPWSLDDYREIREQGYTHEQAAERLKVHPDSIKRRLRKAA